MKNDKRVALTTYQKIEIARQLQQLGFYNYNNILNEFRDFTDYKNNSGLDIYAYDKKNDPNNISFSFNIKEGVKDGPLPGQLYIDKISAVVGIETKRDFDGGVITIGVNHHLSEGPLPSKEQLRKEILDLVEIEDAKEFLHFHKEVANKLKELGFDSSKSSFSLFNPHGLLNVIKVGENINLPMGDGTEKLTIEITIITNEKISSLGPIFAKIEKPVEVNGNTKKITIVEEEFWPGNGPLPSKDQITHNLFQKFELQNLQIRKAKKIIDADNRDIPSENSEKSKNRLGPRM